jgi:TonB-linked SusC/RagA family outer membrane protein
MRKQTLFSVMLVLGLTGGLTVCPLPVNATVTQQTIKVKGQVVDQDGEPLIGATVRVKGVQSGVVTDIDGNFEISAAGNATLVISYVGYKDREVAVRNRAILDAIQLESDAHLLDQVVVVGYGTQKKADLTGSVAVVNADELKRVSHSNISSMLEGKVAGVQITSDGQPGADPAVKIRGLGTFGDTSPLYVIDGVPMGTTIRDFSPNDIETIQVLKDASAGAIYGSRAANGVVIITTKGGKKDQPLKVDYKGYFGVDWIPTGEYDVMNADQYSNYMGQAYANYNVTTGSTLSLPSGYSLNPETGKYQFMDATNTKWVDEMFKTGFRQNHNVNLSGGGAHNTYNVGLDYFQQKGTLKGAGPNYKRFTARVNNTMETKFIKFRTSLVYSHSNQDGMGIGNDQPFIQGMYGMDGANVLSNALLMPPTIQAYDESTWYLDDRVPAAKNYKYDAFGYGTFYESIHGAVDRDNPLLLNNLFTRNTVVDRLVATGSADVDILKMIGAESKNQKLTYKLNLSYSKTYGNYTTWLPAFIESSKKYLSKNDETLTKEKRNWSDFLVENTINYDATFGLHHFNLLAGITYQEEGYNNIVGIAKNLSEPYFLQVGNGESRTTSSYESKHAMTSILGRLIYDYDGKYLLSFILRRDGSSRLTKDIRWGTFPSISVGWRFDKEKFFPIDRNIVNMFKVRASYGELGNENIGEYMYQATMRRNYMTYSFGNNIVSGSSIERYVNDQLAWEKKKTTNIGIDLAMFNNRLEFTAEWYLNKSTDLLYSVPVPDNVGAGALNAPAYTVKMNAATMQNSGFEFSATYRNMDHPFKWQVSANLSTLKNKVKSLGFTDEPYIEGDCITIVGEEVGQFYGYVYEGIARTQADLDDHATQLNANVGDCLYKDVNEDGVINADDRVVLGSGMPKVNFGLSAHFEYKHFDLSISTFGALNYHVTDGLYNVLRSSYGILNRGVEVLDANRWSADGLTYISNAPRTYYAANGENWNDKFSDRYIQNAAYWKIANIELGYNFPDKWFKGVVSGARIYVSAQNLHTFTKYKGYNVDFAGAPFQPGNNWCSYPSARSFMAGVLFSF